MDTKEAIEFIKWLKRQTLNTICYDDEPAKKITENFYNKLEELTDLLKHGDRHVRLAHTLKKMWGEVEMKFKTLHTDFETGEEYYVGVINESDIKELKRKYFPKENYMNNTKTDILIVGAGAAGIAAALSASKTCNNTILAEQLNYVGGVITGGLITHFCGMEGYEKGVIQDIIKELEKYDGVYYVKEMLPAVNPEIFKIVVEGMLIDKGIKILYDSYAYGVIKHNDKIKEVLFRNNYKSFTIEPRVVIDCTGNGDIFYYCGEPFKQYYSKDMPIGLAMRIGGLDETAEEYLISEEGRAFLEKESLPGFEKTAMKSILWTTVNYSSDEYGTKEYEKLTEILIHLRKKALKVAMKLRKNKMFKDTFLLDTAPLLGIRMSRSLRGKSILTYITDSASDADRREAIYECLIPVNTKNLLVAGRCISAELAIMNGLRSIPPCFVMGEIAGSAASLTDCMYKWMR